MDINVVIYFIKQKTLGVSDSSMLSWFEGVALMDELSWNVNTESYSKNEMCYFI